jgi:glycosyltransferase involved in cell wall biosynthesis
MADLALTSCRILKEGGPVEFYNKFNHYRATNRQKSVRVREWIAAHSFTKEYLDSCRTSSRKFTCRPKFSIILPVRNTPHTWLKEAIDSVLEQCYENWELCIADDASTRSNVIQVLRGYMDKDPRIRVVFLEKNQGAAGASNQALALSGGDFICFLDHDDILTPDALFEMACYLNRVPDTDFIYSDELIVNEAGKPVLACYRPGFSLDYLLSHPYFVHFVAIRADLVRSVNGFREDFCISQDYDLFLRVISKTKRIAHIPKILYHWRNHQTSAGHRFIGQVSTYSKKALSDYLEANWIKGKVSDASYFNFYRVQREIEGNPRVSIIIPTRDKVDFLKKCINSIRELTTYRNYELIIVDNCSSEEESLRYFDELKTSCPDVRIIGFPYGFNYSKLNNYAAGFASGEHLLFLNNDIEIISPAWIEALLEQSQREEVCCVGAKLLYPDRKIQHVGVVIGLCGPAEHVFKFSDSRGPGYMGNLTSIRNYSAVTGACMMVKKSAFYQIGGFDERFSVGFSDIDLCMRSREHGFVNVITPFAELLHYESATRGKTYVGDSHPEDTALFREKWEEFISAGDPYYNPNLPLHTLDITPYVLFV